MTVYVRCVVRFNVHKTLAVMIQSHLFNNQKTFVYQKFESTKTVALRSFGYITYSSKHTTVFHNYMKFGCKF